MVVFTCNNCGEKLQRARVERHYKNVCQTTKNLTCVDCHTDYWFEDYFFHMRCEVEDQRIEAKNAAQEALKVEKTHEVWVPLLTRIIERESNLSSIIRDLLSTIATYENVPNKKEKFYEYVAEKMGREFNTNHMNMVWYLIEKHRKIEHDAKVARKQEKKTKAEEYQQVNNKGGGGKQNGNGIKRKLATGENDKRQVLSKRNNTETIETNTRKKMSPQLE